MRIALNAIQQETIENLIERLTINKELEKIDSGIDYLNQDFLNENTDYKIQVDSNGDTLRERINTPELKILFAPQIKYKKFIVC